jgi:hypothetical protein
MFPIDHRLFALFFSFLFYTTEGFIFISGDVDDTKVAYRPRESPYPLITVDEAVSTVMKHTELLGTEEIFYRSESPLT